MCELCERKVLEIIEIECYPNYIYIFIRVSPEDNVSEIIDYLKDKGLRIRFNWHVNLKYKYGNRHFWCRGYHVNMIGKNAKRIVNTSGVNYGRT